MEHFPFELWCLIIGSDVDVYRALLVVPRFARFLTIGKILDFMVLFGYDVRIENVVAHRTLCTLRAMVWGYKGMLHRVNGPAIDCGDMCPACPSKFRMHYTFYNEEWYYLDKLHRLGSPALIRRWRNGYFYNIWYEHGKCHRVDGPAIETTNKDIWCQNHQRHRESKPAVTIRSSDGKIVQMKWYTNDVFVKSVKL